jgi:hypothetical protein
MEAGWHGKRSYHFGSQPELKMRRPFGRSFLCVAFLAVQSISRAEVFDAIGDQGAVKLPIPLKHALGFN